jgi:hypothetical protein
VEHEGVRRSRQKRQTGPVDTARVLQELGWVMACGRSAMVCGECSWREMALLLLSLALR